MPRGTATLVLGLTIGIVGVMIYNRLRYATEEDPEVLLDKLSRRMQDLEKKTTAVVETSAV